MTNEKLAELSPDSIYFVPLKIKDASGYEINKKKHNVLCRYIRKIGLQILEKIINIP